MSEKRVVMIEDTQSLASLYKAYIGRSGLSLDLVICETGKQGLDAIAEQLPDLILLDLMLPDMSGLDILKHLQQEGLSVPVIVMTAHGTTEFAVEAMRLGARDFLEKPIEAERFRVTVKNTLEMQDLNEMVVEFKQQVKRDQPQEIIGTSPVMEEVYHIINNASASKASVFITGQSGTGKELCARAVHEASPRKNMPFVALNCAAIPKDLIESEIFGHIKGAFTGAVNDRKGAAGLASGGTLFLDEICEMDLSLQSKLLRFIQTGTYARVGSEKLEKVDVRFVCATNRDPLDEVQDGNFREDLFYRLHVIPISLPPLSERGDDVLALAKAFLCRINREEGKSFKRLSPELAQALMAYHWPGNVRQLENVIRNAIVLNQGEELTLSMLPPLPGQGQKAVPSAVTNTAPAQREAELEVAGSNPQSPAQPGEIIPLREVEKRAIEVAIEHCEGNVPKAAAMLDVSPSTLYRKLQSWEELTPG